MRAIVIAFLILALCVSGAAGRGLASDASSGGSDRSSTDSADHSPSSVSEGTSFPDSGTKNLFDEADYKRYVDKMFLNGASKFGSLPQGKVMKVLSQDGELDQDGKLIEPGWSQIISDFLASDECWESDTDRADYLKENEDFSNGVSSSLEIHAKQLQRLLKFAADELDLSSETQLIVPVGRVFWQNQGTTYALPAFGAISYRSDEKGQILYPSLEGVGFADDLASSYPYELGQYDAFGLFSQKRST